MKSTIEDFWEMCFYYNVKIIVMICNLMENNKEKCANYWEEPLNNFEISRINDEKTIEPGLICRVLTVQKKGINNREKTVFQIHLQTWDDHTAPKENYGKIIRMIDLIDKNRNNSPIVVHCSAGVGRTGTFISMYNLYHEIMQQINDKNINYIQFSILNLVRKLKEMRLNLVENIMQYQLLYIFVYFLLIERN